MNTITENTAPEAMREQLTALGFTLESSAPLGGVEKDWPHLAYQVRLLYKGKEVIATPYKMGVGHVEPQLTQHSWTSEEISFLHAWVRQPHANFQNKELQSRVAAKLAVHQKVAPTLESVMHSLCSDGEAFFDAQSFEDWASNYGYDTDSRTAEATFNACDAIGRKLAKGIPAAVLEQVRGIVSNL